MSPDHASLNGTAPALARIRRWRRERPRQTVVVVVLAGLLGVVGVVHWLPVNRPPSPSATTADPAAAAPGTQSTAGSTPALDRLVRRFSLAWAEDQLPGLRTTTTPALYTELNARPASTTDQPPAAPSGVLIEHATNQAAAVLATLRVAKMGSDGETGGTSPAGLTVRLALELTNGSAGWRVSRVGAT